MAAADLPAGEPLGFPNCPRCPYARVGPARICVTCASKTLQGIAPGACAVCSQVLAADCSCRNWLCEDPRRRIERIDAIAYMSGALRSKINHYKYQGSIGWRLVFGRLLVGWLEAHAGQWPDLIIANPTYTQPGEHTAGHIEAIIRSAANEDLLSRWPFDTQSPAAVIKTQATSKSAGQTAPAKRRAAVALRRVLEIPDPQRTLGRKILIFDDVCTTGSQLDALAGYLLDEGRAAQVRALVLARATWRPS